VAKHKRPVRIAETLLMFGVIVLAVAYVAAGAVILITNLKGR